VDDEEEDLREAMRRMLERRGFATLTAADPAEAEAVCRDHGGTVDLLLTDLTLPGASGGELAKTATSMRPELRVLFVSGLPKEVAVGQGTGRRGGGRGAEALHLRPAGRGGPPSIGSRRPASGLTSTALLVQPKCWTTRSAATREVGG
jgi:CheY-like chemotaxis protein